MPGPRPGSTGEMNPYRIVPLVALVAALWACGGAPGKRLEVEPPAIGREYLTTEITQVLSDAGFDRVEVRETVVDSRGTEQEPHGDTRVGAVIDMETEYRMMYRAREPGTSIVYVRISRHTGLISLSLYEEGSGPLSESALGQYRKLKRQLVLEFGKDRVAEK